MLKADTAGLRNLAKQLRQSDAKLYRTTQASLREVGKQVADKAKANASRFSTSIPPTVRVGASGVNAVIVRAGLTDKQQEKAEKKSAAFAAKALENHGKGHVRHPVFARKDQGRSEWTWTETNSPAAFLLPAAMDDLQRHAEEVRDALQIQVEKLVGGVERYV